MSTTMTAATGSEVPQRGTFVPTDRSVTLGQEAKGGATAGFASMMNALQATAGRSTAYAAKAPAEQMFESPPAEGGQRRRDVMRDADREDAAKRTDALREQRTGVEARRAARLQNEQAGESALAMPKAAGDAAEIPGGRDPSLKEVAGRAGAEGSGGVFSGETMESERAPSGTDDSGPVSRPRSSGESRSVERPSGHANTELSATPVSAGTVAAPLAGAGSGAATPTAANEVAKLLGAGGNGMESIGAPTASSGAEPGAVARDARADAKANPPSAEKTPARDEKAEKGEAALRTPFAQLVRLMRSQAGRGSSARMMLEPPELGRIHVRVIMKGDRVELGVETEMAAAKELIAGRAERLKSALEQHGIVVDRLEVNTHPAGFLDRPAGAETRSGLSAEGRGERSGAEKSGRHRESATSAGGVGTVVAIGAGEALLVGERRLDIRV